MGRIVFDARSVREVQTGLGRVAANLVRSLARIDSSNQYLVIQRSDVHKPIVAVQPFQVSYCEYDIASVRNAFHFSDLLQRYRPCVYHSLYSFLPFFVPETIKTVVTVHDFNWIQRPSMAAPSVFRGWVNGCYGRPMHAHTTRIADHIVCVSQQTQSDLCNLYPSRTKGVSVIHHGVDRKGLESGNVGPNVRRFGDSRFVLNVGNGRPYKNPEGTIRAFAQLKEDSRYQDIRLLIAGRCDRISQLRECAKVNGVFREIDFLGIVTDAELAFLLKKALLVSFPSYWEGFGLPVIEAFAFGCPVIASNVASLREIASGAAFMIDDPTSHEEIAAAMRKIIDDGRLRQRMRHAGPQEARRFTWDKAARGYLDIYNRLMQAGVVADAEGITNHGSGEKPLPMSSGTKGYRRSGGMFIDF